MLEARFDVLFADVAAAQARNFIGGETLRGGGTNLGLGNEVGM